MGGFMQWFKSSSKLKRWMLLILIGVAAMCYGTAEIIVLKELSFTELAKIIVTFVVGVVAIVLGLVFINKRTLEILIESTDDRIADGKKVNLKSLIFNKKVYNQGPNIVVIGGGTGLNTVLSGLKKYTDNLTAIVTISDYGEEIGESRRELQVKPLDDVKDSIIALANQDTQMNKLFNYKFTEGRLKNFKFSDIYFSAMKNINNDFSESIIKTNEVLNIVGKVIPVTLDEMNINAELENGYVIKEKSKIAEMAYEKVTKINRIYLNPSNCRPAPKVLDVIKEADCIIIGPGSLYTNVIPNLLVNGVAKSIKESTALKVYISNIMTEPGQTDEYTVSDHLNAIMEHVGRGIVDYCIYDTGEIVPEFIKKYNLEGQDLVIPDIDKVKGITYLQRSLSMIADGHIRHDPELVAESIIGLICDDLKYQDKQNDPQYLMLNNKLKEDKRINKLKKQMAKEAKKKKDDNSEIRKNSKFSNKYAERIESIKQSDEMIRLKEEKIKKDKIREEKIKKQKLRRQKMLEEMGKSDISTKKEELNDRIEKINDETKINEIKKNDKKESKVKKVVKRQEPEEIYNFRREYEKILREEPKNTRLGSIPKSQRGRKKNK